MNLNIRLLVKDIKENEFDDRKDIVIIGNVVSCRTVPALKYLLKNYAGDLKEENAIDSDLQMTLAYVLIDIVKNGDFETFKSFTDVFRHTIPYVDLDDNHYCFNDLISAIPFAEDGKVFSYCINHLIFKSHHSYNMIACFYNLIKVNPGKNDIYYDRYLELFQCIESKYKEKEIKSILKFINFSGKINDMVLYNNYQCASILIKYIRKYHSEKSLFNGKEIACAIYNNRLEFADMFIKELGSDKLPESSLKSANGIGLDILTFAPSTQLDNLQYLYEKNIKDEFYSKLVIQLVIIHSMYWNNNFAFTYMINVFPYEAMTIIEDLQFKVYNLKGCNKGFYYKQLVQLKKDFVEFTK